MGIEIQPSRFFQGDTAVLKILVGEDLSNYVATDLTIRVTRPDDTRFAMTTTRTIVSPTVGEISVVIAVASPHRGEAFEACSYAIDRLKESVPIWKKEVGSDGHCWTEIPASAAAVD